jgi:hypothetical protein
MWARTKQLGRNCGSRNALDGLACDDKSIPILVAAFAACFIAMHKKRQGQAANQALAHPENPQKQLVAAHSLSSPEVHPLLRFGYLVLLAAFLCAAALRIAYPDFTHGDEYADASVRTSAENFARHGFLQTVFLPVSEPEHDKLEKPYTHMPTFGHLINAFLRCGLGITDLRLFRLAALCATGVALFAFAWSVELATRSRTLGLLAGAFCLVNPVALTMLDAMESGYADMFRNLTILGITLVAFAPSKWRKASMALAMASFFMVSLVHYDSLPWLGIFSIALTFGAVRSNCRLTFFELGLLGAAPVLGVLLHLVQNMIFFASLHAAVQDLCHVAGARFMGGGTDPGGVQFTWAAWVERVIVAWLERTGGLPISTLLALAATATICMLAMPPGKATALVAGCRFWALMMGGGLVWTLVMPHHCLDHASLPYLPRLLVPGIGLGFAILCFSIWTHLTAAGRERAAVALSVAIGLGIMASTLSKTDLPFSAQHVAREREFTKFRDCLIRFRSMVGEREVIGMNYYRWPFVSYYTDRRVQPTFTASQIEAQSPLPGGFVLLPYNTPETQKLAEVLQQHYTLVFECPNALFPSYFFLRKSPPPTLPEG